MAKIYSKKNLSSMNVLKTLQVLLQGNYTMQELIDKMNEKEPDAIFNNSVISKYINTCRYCGININKLQGKYQITSMPFGINFSLNEINLIANLQDIVRNEFSKKANKIFGNFIEKLNRYSNQEIIKLNKKMYEISTELFENAILERRKVKIILRNAQENICIPLKIVNHKEKRFFNVYSNGKEYLYNLDRVVSLEVLSDKFIQNIQDVSVVFVLKSDLAKRYNLRENERLIQTYSNGDIVISNRNEVKEFLLSRLLRYDDKCEILNPKSYREEMKTIINNTLNNYGV